MEDKEQKAKTQDTREHQNFSIGNIVEAMFKDLSIGGLNKKRKILVAIGAAVLLYIFLSTPVSDIICVLGGLAIWGMVFIGIGLWVINGMGAGRVDPEQVRIRQKTLIQPWRKYNSSCQIVFSKIRLVLKEASYGFGDKWSVISADVQNNKIIADLRLADNFHSEPQKSYLRLEAKIENADGGRAAILKLRFEEESQGRQEEGYEVIRGVVASIGNALGGGHIVKVPVFSEIRKKESGLNLIPIVMAFVVAVGLLNSVRESVQKFNDWVMHIGAPVPLDCTPLPHRQKNN